MLIQYYFSAQQTITIHNVLEDVENATIGFSNPRFNQNEGFREEIEAHALKASAALDLRYSKQAHALPLPVNALHL